MASEASALPPVDVDSDLDSLCVEPVPDLDTHYDSVLAEIHTDRQQVLVDLSSKVSFYFDFIFPNLELTSHNSNDCTKCQGDYSNRIFHAFSIVEFASTDNGF